MADKRISQLTDRGTVANSDVVPIVVSGAVTTNKATISSIQTFMQGNLDLGVTSVGITLGSSGTDVSVSGSPVTSSGNITINFPTASATNRGLLSAANWTTFNNKVSSVGLTMPSAFSVANSPITGSGTLAVTGAGTVSQYVRGDGSLADFPQGGGGGGASVSYYLNLSVSQGSIGGIAYSQMSRVPVFGAGTDVGIASNGYIASFITDAGNPALLEIPAGNWNFETYFSANSGGGSPTFYIELYKVNSGGTATLIASNSGTPESISLGTNINPYYSALAVPTTSLTLTDRLAIRIFVSNSGRTITLHTENSHLCQVITTFTTGLTALNGLTAQVQNFATGSSGTDFNISSASTTHTFNLPDASATARGVVTTGTQTFEGAKTFNSSVTASSLIRTGGTSSQFLKADGSVDSTVYYPNSNPSGFTSNVGTVTSVGLSSATSGVTIGSTPVISSGTITLAIATASGSQNGLLSSTDWTTFNNKTSNLGTVTSVAATAGTGISISGSPITSSGTLTITNTAPDQVVALTASTGISVSGTYPNFTITNTSPSSGGTVTSVSGTGTVSGLTLSGTVASSGNLTLGGTLSLTSGNVTDALGFTPYNATNPAGYITSSALSSYLPLTGGTLTGALSGTSASFTGKLSVTQASTDFVAEIVNTQNANPYGLRIKDAASGANGYPLLSVSNNAGSVEYFRVNSGTGAATFSGTLAVNNEGITINRGAGNGYLIFQTGGTDVGSIYSNTGGGIRLRNATSDVLTIASTGAATFSGNVGIGVGPVLKLDVQGNAADTTVVGGVTAEQVSLFRPSNGVGGIRSGFNTSTGDAYLWSSQSSGNLYLGTRVAPNNNVNVAILSSGNVGIGTASPQSNLQVLGTIKVATGNAQGILALGEANGTTVNVGLWRGAANAPTTDGNFLNLGGFEGIVFASSNAAIGSQTERMRITSGGNVLIGTTSDNGSRFQVTGSNSNSLPLVNLVASGTGPFQRGVRLLNSGMNAGDHIMMAVGQADGARNMGQFYFQYNGSGSTSNRLSLGLHSVDDVFNILGTGNVGIGTASPNAKLNVVNDDGVGSGLHIIADFNRNTSSAELILGYYGDGTNVTTSAIYSANSLPLAFYTGATERMRITSGGNVGIGTASPSSKLQISGSIALPHTTKSANYTLDETDYTVGFDCASNRTANLPDATTCAGRIYVIYQYNTNVGVRYVTLDGNGSQTINGLTTVSLQNNSDYSSVMIQSNGSNWVIISDALYPSPT